MIRRALVMIGLVACGSENPPATTPSEPGSAQQLVIPPMDAGAAPPLVIASSSASSPPVDDHPDSVDDYTVARDPRLKSGTRASRVIIAELQGFDSELASMASNSPARPDLLKKMMDSYAELARAAGAGTPTANTALNSAISRSTLLVTTYPNYSRLDEVRYNQGLAFEQAQKTMDARKSFYELIKTRPDSKFIGCAYFAFGEMFHEETKSDPSKADLAKQAYLEVIKFPAPANSCFKLAKDRLAGR